MRSGTFAPQGWKGDQDRVPVETQWERLLDHVRLIEQAGYESVWVDDHLHTHPVVKQSSTFKAWTLMASLAAVTHRARAEHLAVTVSQAVDERGRFVEKGCTDMILYFYDLGEGDSTELFASEVIPQER